MKKFVTTAIILLIALMASSTLMAQKLEITPFGGFNMGGSFKVDSLYVDKFDLKDTISYGLAISYPVVDTLHLELMWNRQSTELSAYSDAFPGLGTSYFDLNVHRFHFNMVYMMEHRVENIVPFASMGFGATYFDPQLDGVEGATRFSFSIGGGVKIFVCKRIGIRIQLNWQPTNLTKKNGFFYDEVEDDYMLSDTAVMSQLDLMVGLIIRL